MDDSPPRLTQARAAANKVLMRMVADGAMTVDTAAAMATTGFRCATRVLAGLRKDGVCAEHITESFERQLAAGRAAGDQQCINAAEFTLAVWGGMRRDLAAWLSGTEEARTR